MLHENERLVLFPKGVSEDWEEVLSNKRTLMQVYYKDNSPFGIIAITSVRKNLVIVNSGTVDDVAFSFKMIRDVFNITNKTDVLLSTVNLKNSCINRFGDYNEELKAFYIKKRS